MPEPWPTDAATAATLLASVVHDIDERDDEDFCVLLADFLCTAWPTQWAQRQ
jgi:hypothetical protein